MPQQWLQMYSNYNNTCQHKQYKYQMTQKYTTQKWINNCLWQIECSTYTVLAICIR